MVLPIIKLFILLKKLEIYIQLGKLKSLVYELKLFTDRVDKNEFEIFFINTFIKYFLNTQNAII